MKKEFLNTTLKNDFFYGKNNDLEGCIKPINPIKILL